MEKDEAGSNRGIRMLTINSNTTGRDRAIDADTGSVFC